MKPNYYSASFSGGKDSTAMVLELIARKYPLDEVLHCDVGKEFPQMYEHIEKVKKVVEQAGIKFTTLRAEQSFDWYMFEKPVKGRIEKGYSWATSRNRWCTSKLKSDIVRKYLAKIRQDRNVYEYLGIAYDEQYRLERKNNKQESHLHPLVDWKWTEKDCLNYCYERGYNWGGLYEIFKRVSCWCCPLQPIGELRKLRKHFPKLWQELGEMDKRARRRFKPNLTVEQLELRFSFEDERIRKGLPINDKDFYAELRFRLGRAETKQMTIFDI